MRGPFRGEAPAQRGRVGRPRPRSSKAIIEQERQYFAPARRKSLRLTMPQGANQPDFAGLLRMLMSCEAHI
ncbi:MAG TPA: hypothetical protein DCY26_04790 [Hyphomonas sp.]|nr:hypothetical protein [Hyphomonas sp.]